MEHQESSVDIFEKFTWKITNFTQLKNVEKIYSEPFILGGYPWRIILYPQRGYIGLFFEAVQKKTDQMSKFFKRDAKYKLTVFNQLNPNQTITEEFMDGLWLRNSGCGYRYFMPLVDFHDPKKGFIVEDVCIVEVERLVRESTIWKKVNQAVTLEGHTKLEGATNDLEVSWEELKKYRSDLTWLEPHVQSALEIKSYVDKALHVLKETEAAVEIETEKLKKKLLVNLDEDKESC